MGMDMGIGKSKRKIGIMANCFRVDVTEGIKKAARLGADAVQLNVGARGAVSKVWTKGYRSEIRKALEDNGLALSAMCGDLGGHGFQKEEDNQWKIEETARMLELTREMGSKVLTSHIGVVPQDEGNPRFKVMQDAMSRLGEYAKQEGVRVAIETGPEPTETLAKFLEGLPEGWVGVNYDPANLRMVCGVDPVKGVAALKGKIYHTHVKDGKMLRYVGPEKVYGYFADGGIEDIRMEECFVETPLGEGEVDLPAWFKALDEIGYDGYYTIEREVGQNPEADIAMAVEFIKTHG
ncbi:MAG: sugar phosphate isomerase/epimerase [Oscillospiraceae bacterium]|jgi:sugar phosphate isomerase/epimerase|nr:sugar phosphate isomerase/epimerase [Oscillospiraceae bacterium]